MLIIGFLIATLTSICSSQNIVNNSDGYSVLDDAVCKNAKLVDASRIAESSGIGSCRLDQEKFCYNINWISAFRLESLDQDQPADNSTTNSNATVRQQLPGPGADSSASGEMAYTCFDEIIVYFNQIPEAECCDGFLRITFRPRAKDAIFFNIDPINYLLCDDKRKVFLGLKANWTIDGETEVFDESYDVLLNDDLPTCRGELANSTTAPEVTPRPTEPPPSKALRSSIPFIILGCIVALIAICFIFSMCKKKREADTNQLPKSKPKSKKEGDASNANQEKGGTKEASNDVRGLEDLDGADAKAKELYGARNQKAIIGGSK